MATSILTEQQATVVGRRKIRNSQITAFVVGGVILASGLLSWERWLPGLLFGLVYANAFEYVTHRVLLHGTTGYLHEGHERHHVTWGHEDEALYVRFGPPVAVIFLFIGNSLPLIFLDRLGAGMGAGALAAFVVYYSLYEEFHWRIHLGYLPPWLAWMRKHHFAHHKGAPGKYNVLVPVWDWLLKESGVRSQESE